MIYLVSLELATGHGSIWQVLLHLSDVKETFQEKVETSITLTTKGNAAKTNCTEVGKSTATFNPLPITLERYRLKGSQPWNKHAASEV